MSDTSFRTWMNNLLQPAGARPEWPVLLRSMLEEEFVRQQAEDRTYSGERILIPRHKHDYQGATGEKRAVYGLYHSCLDQTSGCLKIGDESYWLLSYEVPNQGGEKGRRADLVGISQNDGLVVFEGKLGNNPYPPLSAILEGLDYLACLTCKTNFQRVQEEFPPLVEKIGKIPEGFGIKEILREESEVIILAPKGYYEKFARSKRGGGWQEMVSEWGNTGSPKIRFAVSEITDDGFFSQEVNWVNPEEY